MSAIHEPPRERPEASASLHGRQPEASAIPRERPEKPSSPREPSEASAALRERRPEIFISHRDDAQVAADLAAASGPLAGLRLAVKNNVDVAGFPTTAACPAFAPAPPTADAQAVARLRAAGATVVGVTNLDQFATGLVGQRSPYGGVRDARRPQFVSGGSSSGSAVAVALGLADLAIGTDTAGSGRVPAALQGITGIKPTLGTVSVAGVVPACRSYDAVTIMARDLDTAGSAMAVMAGGPGTRPWPPAAPLAAPAAPRVAVPDELPAMDPGWAEAFTAVVERLRATGAVVQPIRIEPFLAAARLLYDGALVAERHAAVGAFVDAHPGEVDPTVGAIISRAGRVSGSDLVRDLARLERLREECMDLLDGFDALLVPTAPCHPTVAEVAAEPVAVNSRVGTYTNFCNLFDLCAVAVPAGTVDEGPDRGIAQFGVTVVARPFHDAVAFDLARLIAVRPEPPAEFAGGAPPLPADRLPWPAAIADGGGVPAVELFVVGAHLAGQPLEPELRALGARWDRAARTCAAYTLHALDTVPPKPGLTRVGAGGSAVEGEVWLLPEGALGRFLARLPAPMTLGRVELSDGRWVVGFGCTQEAVSAGEDITKYGGWRAWLAGR
ncbi:allophanate hydrolase [Nonomuraea gerenzanensis]|uniref:Allophanate hydrolase n=1 Tax=Nonomuraea gerenzanensis TaxID=93944 RepID=A0A1M4EET8_9ACTN|nr:allophanate hydrolase [Nonomuraea gerenzanensis]UBU09091.1 allophanate hydrolase [Nonomuraea gerenzanensis]SBO97477.1 Allophanate hydrolase [Nonomuraea gerenzanensis]